MLSSGLMDSSNLLRGEVVQMEFGITKGACNRSWDPNGGFLAEKELIECMISGGLFKVARVALCRFGEY